MVEKLDVYDLLSTLVLGAILMTWVPMWFPEILHIETPEYPDEFKVVVLVCLALIVGNVIHALANLAIRIAEGRTGKPPTEIALERGLGRYFPIDTAHRIKSKLRSIVGEKASDRSLTLYAIQRTDAAGVGRVARFNGLYAFHTGFAVALAIMLVVFLASMIWGSAREMGIIGRILMIAGLLSLTVLILYRAKQRAYYYASELFLTVERVIDEGAEAKSTAGED